jgi:sec-independent protein translocase protein TatB
VFGLSFFETLILAGIALVVIGPKQLPELARVLGRFLSEMKKASAEVRGQFKVDLLGGVEELRADQKHILEMEADKKAKIAASATTTPMQENEAPQVSSGSEKPPGEKT